MNTRSKSRAKKLQPDVSITNQQEQHKINSADSKCGVKSETLETGENSKPKSKRPRVDVSLDPLTNQHKVELENVPEVRSDSEPKPIVPPCDPFKNLHSDVHDLIFQHFTSRDVLKSSLVSTSWFKATEASAKCAEKLHLHISLALNLRESSKKSAFFSQDIRSKRKYCNIHLDGFEVPYEIQEAVKLLTGRRWKKVWLDSCGGYDYEHESESDISGIIEAIEEHVEELSISSSESNKTMKLGFPKLTKLELSYSDGFLEMFEAFTGLKCFKVDLEWMPGRRYCGTMRQGQRFRRERDEFERRNPELINQILVNNCQLEELEIRGCRAQDISLSDEKIQFRLKVFKFNTVGIINNVDAQDKISILNFLQNHMNTLETLELEQWFGIEVLKLVLEMPKLDKLSMSFDSEASIDWDNLQLNTNTAIKSFEWRGRVNNVRQLKAVFDAMPNLHSLAFSILNDPYLKVIGPRCQNLEELSIRSCEAKRVDDPLFFPKIKSLRCKEKVKGKHMIERKSRERRTPFEQLLLETVETVSSSDDSST